MYGGLLFGVFGEVGSFWRGEVFCGCDLVILVTLFVG